MRLGRRTPGAVPRSRLRPRELGSEALAGILQRPGRTALTILGAVLGIGAFVAVLGLTSTASGQVSKRFTVLGATEVRLEQADDPQNAVLGGLAFPADADDRVRALNGVSHAGVFWQVRPDTASPVTGVPLPGLLSSGDPPVIAASAGLLPAVHPTMEQGRLFDELHNDRGDRVAVLGKAAAARLGITRLDVQPAIFVGGVTLTVMGIMADVERQPDLLMAVLVPRHTAESLWGVPDDPAQRPQMLIETRLGAAKVVAAQAAVALRPDAPDAFRVIAPSDPTSLQDQVGSDLSGLFLVLAGICLLVGTVGIANTTLVAVLERIPEIGLRRALGARRRHIAAQFLAESAALGGLGGLVGSSFGVGTVVVVAIVREWTPVLAPWTVLPAPLLGAVAGLVAGLYPAYRASRIEPADALRR